MNVHAYMFKQSQDIDPMDYGQYREYKLTLSGEDIKPMLLFQKGVHTARVHVLKQSLSGGRLDTYKGGDEVVLVLTDLESRVVIYGTLQEVYRETCPVSDIFVVEMVTFERYFWSKRYEVKE